MSTPYHLGNLTPESFQNLVNSLLLRVLGQGSTQFSPGPDAGRDGLFVGEAPYPSESERWSGSWYIQCKFHAKKVSSDEQFWLLTKIKEELKEFTRPNTKRTWPNNWIIATNVDPSGQAETGTYDKSQQLVTKAQPSLKNHFHIWGGKKILDLLHLYPEVASGYAEFLTTGHIIRELMQNLTDTKGDINRILHHIITDELHESEYAKLEQAGSTSDNRPGIHQLFVDLPSSDGPTREPQQVLKTLLKATSAKAQPDPALPPTESWLRWSRDPSRARVWILKGGPGQGKTTIGQYFCQLQRAALILQGDLPSTQKSQDLATDIRDSLSDISLWPQSPRIPIQIELKNYAQWLTDRKDSEPRNLLSFLCAQIHQFTGHPIHIAVLERALERKSWILVLDGLDEVPTDSKEETAKEIEKLLRWTEQSTDLFALCTSRPQGYTGQLDRLGGATINLAPLNPDEALQCAEKLIRFQRSKREGNEALATLRSAMQANSVRSIMQTPLQAHIMAVIVRARQHPPEMRWRLYQTFYNVILQRERARNHADPTLNELFQKDSELLTMVHDYAGFALHAKAESSEGSAAALDQVQLRNLVGILVDRHKASGREEIVNSLMVAAKERLVLLSTPESTDRIRYDVRQLQEFFAARFLFHDVDLDELRTRIQLVAGDVHWREVLHFLMSALVDTKRRNELSIANEILGSLDSGDGIDATTPLAKRLARGGGIIAHLLEEGVLEGSKADRARFRNTLRSCLTLLTSDSQLSLLSTSAKETRAWLRDFVLEHLATHQISEGLGALSIAWIIIDDTDANLSRIKECLSSLPQITVRLALSELRKEWQWDCFLAALRHESIDTVTRELHFDGISQLRDSLLKTATSLILESEEYSFLTVALSSIFHSYKRDSEESLDFGWAKPLYISRELRSAPHLEETLGEFSLDDGDTGVLGLLKAKVNFEINLTRSSLLSCLKLLPRNFQYNDSPILSRYPAVHRFSPGEVETLIEELHETTDREFKENLKQNRLTSSFLIPETWSITFGVGTLDQFAELAGRCPSAALLVWLFDGIDGDSYRQLRQDPEASKLVAKIIHKMRPEERLRVSPVLWHYLVRNDKTIRNTLVSRCASEDHELRRGWHFGQGTREEEKGIKLHLPKENRALLEVGSFIIRTAVASQDHSRVGQLAQEFVDSYEKLNYILSQPSMFDEGALLGASILSILHPEADTQGIVQSKQILIAALSKRPESTSLFLEAVWIKRWFLLPEIRSLLGELISLVPLGASSERHWLGFFGRLREYSTSPISTGNLLEGLLEYAPKE